MRIATTDNVIMITLDEYDVVTDDYIELVASAINSDDKQRVIVYNHGWPSDDRIDIIGSNGDNDGVPHYLIEQAE